MSGRARSASKPRAVIPMTPRMLAKHPLLHPDHDADKEARGQVLVIGSSRSVPGAAMLTGVAALRAGAGKLKLAVPRSLAVNMGLAVPESGIIALPETADGEPKLGVAAHTSIAEAAAIVLGPGLMSPKLAAQMTRAVMKLPRSGVLILDAWALNAVGRDFKVVRGSGPVVLTPNHSEMADLMNVAPALFDGEPGKAAREVAVRTGAYVVLKSRITHVVTPDGEAWEHEGGSPGLATSGSGDVLAGVIAGLAARCADPVTACLWGVVAHARAGKTLARRVGRVGFLARELLDEVPAALER